MEQIEDRSIGNRFRFTLIQYVRTGWWSISNKYGEDNYILCIVFHTHPDDGDKTEELIRPLLNDFWFFDRFAPNRFLLCSELYHQLSIIEKRDIHYINEIYSNLGYETGRELKKLIERINAVDE